MVRAELQAAGGAGERVCARRAHMRAIRAATARVATCDCVDRTQWHPTLNYLHSSSIAAAEAGVGGVGGDGACRGRRAGRAERGRRYFESSAVNAAMMFFTMKLNSIQFNSIQFNSIQFNSIQFNSIQFNSIQFNSIQFNSIQFDCAVVAVVSWSSCRRAESGAACRGRRGRRAGRASSAGAVP